MIIQSFCSGPFETNAYVIACPDTHEAAIVDPAPESADTLSIFITKRSLKPVKILLTHTHLDHIADVPAIKKQYAIPVYVHPEDAPNLITPGADGLPNWFGCQSVTPDVLYQDGDKVTVGHLTFEVIHTPGHSPGGICLYEPTQGVLVSGDTLFHQSIGNLSLPSAQPERMWPSLARLAHLPGDTRVYPGHGSSTTIAAESWLPNARQIFESIR